MTFFLLAPAPAFLKAMLSLHEPVCVCVCVCGLQSQSCIWTAYYEQGQWVIYSTRMHCVSVIGGATEEEGMSRGCFSC